MKTEFPCGIVQDLLPGYIDGLTGEATNTAVEEHLAHCEACAKMYDEMNAEIAHTTVNVDDKKLLKQSQKKLSKRIWKVAVIVALTVAIALTGIYGFYFLYWGRRHSVLYDVKTVYVVKSETEEDVYNITLDVTAKNWSFDLIPHSYQLVVGNGGAYGEWDFHGESQYFTSSVKPTDFQIDVRFDISTYFSSPELGEEIVYDKSLTPEQMMVKIAVLNSCFAAVDKYGNNVDSAYLYMRDNLDTQFIFE